MSAVVSLWQYYQKFSPKLFRYHSLGVDFLKTKIFREYFRGRRWLAENFWWWIRSFADWLRNQFGNQPKFYKKNNYFGMDRLEWTLFFKKSKIFFVGIVAQNSCNGKRVTSRQIIFFPDFHEVRRSAGIFF